MEAEQLARSYIASVPEPRRADLGLLHETIRSLSPEAKLWFLDGKDETGKVVSNPSIGYGSLEKVYANGKSREFYQVGISANSAGITVYCMGITDRTYLRDTYGATIGKADITGYCIKFRTLKNVDLEVLKQAILDGLRRIRA